MQARLETAVSMSFLVFTSQKLLKLVPTSDERKKIDGIKTIKDAKPLARAESFLCTMASIPELESRLTLLKFHYSFQQDEEVYACMIM